MLEMISVVLKSLRSKPATRDYPRTARGEYGGARGHIENDIAACVFCGACVRKCPPKALQVRRAEREWVIDPFRCIVCGACVEACPRKCLRMSEERLSPAVLQSSLTLRGAMPAPKGPRATAAVDEGAAAKDTEPLEAGVEPAADPHE